MVRPLTVDEFTDGLLVRITISNKWFHDLQHLQGSLGKFDEDTIVDLKQAEKLQRLTLLRVNLVDALDADDKDKVILCGDIDAVALLGLTRQPYPLLVCVAVLLHILFSPCEDDLSLLLALLCHLSVLTSM